ncbi:MAG: hypothetical protein ABWZ98_13045 [Nakamurella sp.]
MASSAGTIVVKSACTDEKVPCSRTTGRSVDEQFGSFTPGTPTGWVAEPDGTEPTTDADVLVGDAFVGDALDAAVLVRTVLVRTVLVELGLDGGSLAAAETDGSADADSVVVAELPAVEHPVRSIAAVSNESTKTGRPDAGPSTVLINRHRSAVLTGATRLAHPVSATCTMG